jgi:large subunit ribosomal protein L54
MTGLSVLKDQPDPVALPDDQYPDWLWPLLPDPKAAAGKGQEAAEARIPGDLKSSADFREEKKRLRAA